jgi:glyoxylase-like metal-dependent hydrolase (beta-lactamase superfamily II)
VAARLIDVRHLGRERVIGCFDLDGVLVDPGPVSCLQALLEALGEERPRALLLTHIHLDHAGASGALVERWPDLEVYVHERGAPHLLEPSRLLESAGRLYGDDMQRLWGNPALTPIPERNLRVLEGGERMLGGGFEVAYTPGHASHHVCYLHEGTAFVGDVGGVRIEAAALTVPPTPPPDIDVEAWHESIGRIRAWQPRRLAITHFGFYEDVEAQLDEVGRRLDQRARRAREQDREKFIAGIEAEIAEGAEPDIRRAYTQAAPPDQMYAGLERYWRKRTEAPGTRASPVRPPASR